MVNLSSQRVDRVFHALADATRRHMLLALTQTDKTVSELAAPYSMSLAAASKHLKVLEEAQLIKITKQGRSRICHLRRKTLRTAGEVIAHYESFWNDRLDSLAAHLEAEAGGVRP